MAINFNKLWKKLIDLDTGEDQLNFKIRVFLKIPLVCNTFVTPRAL